VSYVGSVFLSNKFIYPVLTALLADILAAFTMLEDIFELVIVVIVPREPLIEPVMLSIEANVPVILFIIICELLRPTEAVT